MFPLELTPLELLFFNDNRPDRPANFVIQLDLTGVAERKLLEQAFHYACSRHPLVQANVFRGRNWSWCWRKSERQPRIEWLESPAAIDIRGEEKIDLRRQVGLRVWACSDDKPDTGQSTTLILEFNHACTDGIGAYRFIGDWLAIYHSLYSGHHWDQDLPSIDPERLPWRFARLKKEIRKLGWWNRLVTALREGVRYVGPPINRIHPRRRPESAVGFPGVVSQSLSEQEHAQLKKAAVSKGYSVNDLLIAELFLTIADWNRQYPSWSWDWRKRIRLSLPTDMRDQSDYMTSATNLTALAFLTRHQSELHDPEHVRSSVRDEVLSIRNNRHGLNNLITLDVLSHSVLPLLWLSTRAGCCYSAVISNIGDPSRRMLNQFQKDGRRILAGNLKLDLITGVPPMRPGTNAAVSIFSYRRLLTVSLKCAVGQFSLEDTGELLSNYMRRLRDYLEPPEPSAGSAN